MSGTPTDLLARLLVAPALVVSLAVLAKSSDGVGDGFTAGLILATGVLVGYVVLGREEVERRLPVRFAPFAVQAGLVVTLAVVVQSILRGRSLLVHVPAPGTDPIAFGTLKLTSGVAFEIGIFLIVAGGVISLVHALAVVADEGEARE